MSDVARDELEGVIERLVDEYTPGDDLEDWDLPELETQLRQIWPVGIDVAGMAPETVDREKLKDALDDDAMNAYDEREQQFGEELMRYLERSILLQVIDNRWREHLYDMDYLREGIHLRGFAQIDPLVAYKNEGFAMFEELMHSIWEEFSQAGLPRRGRNRSRARPKALRRQRRRRADRARLLGRHARGAALGAAAGARPRVGRSRPEPPRKRPRRRSATAPPSRSRRWSRTSTRRSAATTPAGAGRARSTRSATGREGPSRRGFRLTFSCVATGRPRFWAAKKYKTLHPHRDGPAPPGHFRSFNPAGTADSK